MARFSLLLFALSVPFWALGPVADGALLPPGRPNGLSVTLFMAGLPAIVAWALTRRERGPDGARALLGRAFDFRRIPSAAWYAAVFGLPPLLAATQYPVTLALGRAVPDPRVPWLLAPALFVPLFALGIGEELGWQGYAYPRLRARLSPLGAALAIGVLWAAWHATPYLTQHPGDPAWALWQCVATVGLRVLVVWVYEGAGRSVFAAACFHAMVNVTGALFPNMGSHYDPLAAAMVVWAAAAAAIAAWPRPTSPPGPPFPHQSKGEIEVSK